MEQLNKPLDKYNACTDAIGVIRALYLEGILNEDKARDMIGTCLWGPEPGSVYKALLSIQEDYDTHRITEEQASNLVVELISSLNDADLLTYSQEDLEHRSHSV